MRNIIWATIIGSLAILILLAFAMTSNTRQASAETEVSAVISPVANPEDRIKLSMVQCLNREELKGLMGQCWEDAEIKDDTMQSRATIAAAIFAVRVDNIQSGKEPYMREWTIGAGDE